MIYVLQVQTGKEKDVRAALMRGSITAYVPAERIIIRKGGMWTKVLKLLFPGYVFVEVDFSADMFHRIKPISGVIRFLGSPSPLKNHEADMIRWLSNGGEIIEPSEAITNENGDITGFKGFLNGCEDKISYINRRQKKASVSVRFGGTAHKANISFDFPEKSDDKTGQG